MMPLQEIRFRSNPRVELKRLDDLDDALRESLRGLERDPDFYGVFVPRPPFAMNLKSVARPAADLFRTLVTPARLDDALLRDGQDAADVVDLVLDGILEIESSGCFVSGAAALPLLCPPVHVPEARDAAARLSRAALLHAQDLESGTAQALSNALYLYNRLPVTPSWRARFPDGDAVLAHVGADRGSLRALLERDWVASRNTPGWLSWWARGTRPSSGEEATYKLYVSPRPERIREAFEVVVRVLSGCAGTHVKIGDRAAGLLRPDKLVIHFPSRVDLEQAVADIRRELAGCEAHGVPFTAGLDDSGLLSWGVDPPDSERVLDWTPRQSWRLWLAKRLGAAMEIAKSAGPAAAVEPWLFAMDRARRHGVDIGTWTPSATLWSRA